MTEETKAKPVANGRSNGETQKAFGGVMAIIAVMATCVGALVAITRPLSQRIDALERSIEVQREALIRIDDRERVDAGSLSGHSARLDALEKELRRLEQERRSP